MNGHGRKRTMQRLCMNCDSVTLGFKPSSSTLQKLGSGAESCCIDWANSRVIFLGRNCTTVVHQAPDRKLSLNTSSTEVPYASLASCLWFEQSLHGCEYVILATNKLRLAVLATCALAMNASNLLTKTTSFQCCALFAFRCRMDSSTVCFSSCI